MTTLPPAPEKPTSPTFRFLSVPEHVPAPNPIPSPTSLSVPGQFFGGYGSGVPRRASSTASSIFDLSSECEQLEKALRDNDTFSVKKILQIHHNKFPVNLHGSILDKSSCDSRSRRTSHSHVSQDVEILLRKSQTLIDRFDRRESFNTDASDVPTVFKNCLHIAIQHNAIDVLKVLLKYGVDSNEPVHNLLGASRRGSCAIESSNNNNSPARQESRAIIGSTSFDDGRDSVFLPVNVNSQSPRHRTAPQGQCPQNTPTTSASDSNISYHVQPRAQQHDRLPEIVESSPEGEFDFAKNYSTEDLFSLPPLYIAVVEGRPQALRLLLRYGAVTCVQDRYGCTPLHVACCSEYFNWDCAYHLLKHGARVKIANHLGICPFHLWPDLIQEQQALVKSALALKLVSTDHGRRTTHSMGHSSLRSESISRFFKRLGTDSRNKSKEKKVTIDPHSDGDMRERASSIGSVKSIRSRYPSVGIVEDIDSDLSLVYMGKSYDGDNGQNGLGYRVVTDLASDLQGKHHHLFFDSFFTSVPLLRRLLQDGIYACGTVRSNRKGFPQEFKSLPRMEQGQSSTLQDGPIVATAWCDKRNVFVMSTTSSPLREDSAMRRQSDGSRVRVTRPEPVADYQKNFRGVDLCDQLRAAYSVGRPSKKWWKYILNFIINIAVINAFITYKEAGSSTPKRYRQFDFRVKLIKQLISGFSYPKTRSAPGILPLCASTSMQHRWMRLKRKRSTCKMCKKMGKRTDTVFGCLACNKHFCSLAHHSAFHADSCTPALMNNEQ